MSKANEHIPQGAYVAKGSPEHKDKKQAYLRKLNNKEIKQSLQATLSFYEIHFDEGAERYV